MAPGNENQNLDQQMGQVTLSPWKTRLTPEKLRERAAKKREQHKLNMEIWAAEALTLPGPPPRLGPLPKTRLLTDESKSAVGLGPVNKIVPVKRELRRYLIETLVAKHEPRTTLWASDCHSIFVSVRKLYKCPSDEIKLSFEITPKKGEKPVVVDAKISFVGLVRTEALQKHVAVQDRVKIPAPPDKELQALNIVSWKNINDSSWNGGRIGNKFFPNSNDLKRDLPMKKPYQIGSSCGDGSIFLNANATASAFFSEKMNLAEWMWNRWGTENPTLEQAQGLKDVRVMFICEHCEQSKRDKLRVISEISRLTIEHQTFKGDNGKMVKVFDHMSIKVLVKRSIGTPAASIWGGLPLITRDVGNEEFCLSKHWYGWGFQENAFLGDFCLNIENDFVEVRPQRVPRPQLTYKNRLPDTKFNGQTPATWNLVNVAKSGGFASAARKCEVVHVIGIGFRKEKDNAKLYWLETFAQGTLATALRSYGLAINSAVVDEAIIPNVNRKTVMDELTDIYNKWGTPQVILISLPKQKKDIPLYSHFKWWDDCVVGVPSICVTYSTLNKIKQAEQEKVQRARKEYEQGGRQGHGAKRDDRKVKEKRTCLPTYGEIRKKLPKHVLFYRGGVSEGQFGMVKKEELPQSKLLLLLSKPESRTNKICYTGSRATTALSICTPIKYADPLCNRLRCYMKPILDSQMLNEIYDDTGSEYKQNPWTWKASLEEPANRVKP
ncbi:hypothetical protein G7Y89_g12819 [Cudoniella acicularis]|uniref:Piwi domain-containing protein n=1 Tax=Cudoniella acicularis TaxID=354080 RepID=A0A8H4VWM1_9HELO|nr:hypothetical protein G7Y89_g12819 [Cudoniella acicularis]